MFGSFSVDAAPQRPSPLVLPGDPAYEEGMIGQALAEKGRWKVLQILDKFDEDIDWYRKVFGKARGEDIFFQKYSPRETLYQHGNLLLVGGVAALWQFAIGNGVGTSGNTLAYISNANAVLGIGDSTTAESYSQQDLQASSNKYYQGMDSTYPLTLDVVLPGQTTVKAASAASNASPIQVTVSSHGYSTGDVIYAVGFAGNTAPNNQVWQITVVDANNFTLNGSTGNGSYTSGGTVTKSNVIVFKATVGAGNANYAWNEWVLKNGTGGSSRAFNRRQTSLGTKSGGTWALSTAIAIA